MPQLDIYSIDNNGLDGPDGVKFATGTVRLSAAPMSFTRRSGSSNGVEKFVEVAGIYFIPTKIIITRQDGSFPLLSTYIRETVGGQSVTCMGDNVFNVTGNAYVNETGFLIPCRYTEAGDPLLTWYAYS